MSGGANQVLALLVLDGDSNRLAVKYCKAGKTIWDSVEDQRKFEKKVIAKLPKPTGRATETDVAIISDTPSANAADAGSTAAALPTQDFLVLYRICNDVFVIAVCGPSENELTISMLLDGLYSAISQATSVSFVNQGMTKQSVLDCLDSVLLVLDECVDDGIIMEVDDEKIYQRYRMEEPQAQQQEAEVDGRVFQQATQAAKKRLIESLLGGR